MNGKLKDIVQQIGAFNWPEVNKTCAARNIRR